MKNLIKRYDGHIVFTYTQSADRDNADDTDG